MHLSELGTLVDSERTRMEEMRELEIDVQIAKRYGDQTKIDVANAALDAKRSEWYSVYTKAKEAFTAICKENRIDQSRLRHMF